MESRLLTNDNRAINLERRGLSDILFDEYFQLNNSRTFDPEDVKEGRLETLRGLIIRDIEFLSHGHTAPD